jgi:hypothetical protein
VLVAIVVIVVEVMVMVVVGGSVPLLPLFLFDVDLPLPLPLSLVFLFGMSEGRGSSEQAVVGDRQPSKQAVARGLENEASQHDHGEQCQAFIRYICCSDGLCAERPA